MEARRSISPNTACHYTTRSERRRHMRHNHHREQPTHQASVSEAAGTFTPAVASHPGPGWIKRKSGWYEKEINGQIQVWVDPASTRLVDPPRNARMTPIPSGRSRVLNGPPPGFIRSHRTPNTPNFGPDPENPDPSWQRRHSSSAYWTKYENGCTTWYFDLFAQPYQCPFHPHETTKYELNPSWEGIKQFFGE